jgi:hypothetical protein
MGDDGTLMGTVSAGTAVVIGITVAATLVVLGLLWAALSLLRTARQLRILADELANHTAVVLDSVEVAMTRAQGDLDRVDDLIGSAEAINQAVGSTSRLARLAFSGPLIKIMALRAGTARAGRRLRRAS